VLDRDVDLAPLPLTPDLGHRRGQDLEVHLFHVVAGVDGPLENTPSTTTIGVEQAPQEFADVVAGATRIIGRPRILLAGVGPALEFTQRVRSDLPDTLHAGGGQLALTHVSICGHVVHAENLGRFVERHGLRGHVL